MIDAHPTSRSQNYFKGPEGCSVIKLPDLVKRHLWFTVAETKIGAIVAYGFAVAGVGLGKSGSLFDPKKSPMSKKLT